MAANPAVSLTVVAELANCRMPGDAATATFTVAWLFAGDRSNSSPVTLAVQVAGPATIGCKMMVRVVLAPPRESPIGQEMHRPGPGPLATLGRRPRRQLEPRRRGADGRASGR